MNKSYIFKIPLSIIIFAAIILGMHYSSLDFNIDNMFATKKIVEIKSELDEATNDIANLKMYIGEHENELKTLKQDIENLILQNLENYSYISELAISCGRTDVRGPGITIRMADNLTDDTLNINDKIVHDLDVRMIINDLNSAGAEAIAINGKRIVSTTEIICIGPVIRVNDQAVAAPFIIKAIGEPDTLLEKAITSEDSYAYDIKTNYGIDITAIKSYDISISGNTEDIEVNYAKLYEEGE